MKDGIIGNNADLIQKLILVEQVEPSYNCPFVCKFTERFQVLLSHLERLKLFQWRYNGIYKKKYIL